MAVRAAERASERGELAREVAGEIYHRLRELTRGDRELERWLAEHIRETPSILWLGGKLVDTSRSREELEEKVGRVLEALPRYARLVRKILDIEEQHDTIWNVPRRAFEAFRLLAPLASKPRRVGLRVRGLPVYVGYWIEVWGTDIEKYLSKREALELVLEHADEIAEHVDEGKRKAFRRLVDLARLLTLDPSRPCAGDVSTHVYDYDRDSGRWTAAPVSGRLCVDEAFHDWIQVGEHVLDVLDPSDLVSLVPIMDDVERLYDRLEGELKRTIESNKRVLRLMEDVARLSTSRLAVGLLWLRASGRERAL